MINNFLGIVLTEVKSSQPRRMHPKVQKLFPLDLVLLHNVDEENRIIDLSDDVINMFMVTYVCKLGCNSWQ